MNEENSFSDFPPGADLMMSQDPFFSILIVNYNGAVHLAECLESLRKQTYQRFELVVVDNFSTDRSLEILERDYPEARVIKSPKNLGFAGGNNLGIPKCKGEYVFFLNNDTFLPPDTLSEFLKAMERQKNIRIFAGLMINYSNRSIVDTAGDTLYRVGSLFSFRGYPTTLFNTDRLITSACGGAAVFSVKVLDKIGFFDEDFFLNLEDVDLSLRAQHLGEPILLVSKAIIYHKGSATLGGKYSETSVYYSERNHLWLLIKNFPLRDFLKTFPWFMLLKILRLLNYFKKGLLIPALKGNRDSLKQLKKMLRKRKEILNGSTLPHGNFSKLLRKNWFIEKIKFQFKNYNIQV